MLNFRLALIHCLTMLNGSSIKESFIQPLLLAVANHSSLKNDSFLIQKARAVHRQKLAEVSRGLKTSKWIWLALFFRFHTTYQIHFLWVFAYEMPVFSSHLGTIFERSYDHDQHVIAKSLYRTYCVSALLRGKVFFRRRAKYEKKSDTNFSFVIQHNIPFPCSVRTTITSNVSTTQYDDLPLKISPHHNMQW